MFLRIEDYPTLESARDAYPAAAEIVECEGGWQKFDTYADYETWLGQE